MVRTVAEGVYLLEVSWPEPFGSNVYLVDDGEDLTLVDAGMPLPRRSIAAEVGAAGYDLSDLDRVLLTHYDIDHVGGLARLDVDVPVHLGAADADLVERSWTPPLGHHKGAFHRLARRVYSLSGVDLRPVEDGDRIGGFRAVHTPGHNPGHTVYLHDDAGAALLGDLVWEDGGAFTMPVWLDSYDVDRIVDSVRRVADESFEHGCVAHGDPLTPDGDDALRALAVSL
jgi:glyoxylase-like metal-dependent hydrolase (beta-lactamase superfamily II)